MRAQARDGDALALAQVEARTVVDVAERGLNDVVPKSGTISASERTTARPPSPYAETDAAWVAFIKRLKDTGMPLADIERYAKLRTQGDATLQQRLDLLEEHRADVEGKLQRRQDNLAHLDGKIAFYRSALAKIHANE